MLAANARPEDRLLLGVFAEGKDFNVEGGLYDSQCTAFDARCAIGACTVAPSSGHDPLQGEAVGEVAASSTEEMVPVPAALSGDPAPVDDVIRPRSCIADTTCPDPKSCGSWSVGIECDEQCLPQLCQGGAEGVLGRGFSNSFRDCTLANGSACREWRVTTFSFCGC